MKNTTTFLKGLRVLAIIGLFLGLIIPLSRANAQVVMVTGSITASPGTICAGESSTISWSSTDATSINITPGIGSVAPYGQQNVSPTQTTTYTMTLSNSSGGYGTASATVYVSGTCNQPNPTPTVALSANPSNVSYGDSSILSWNSTNATSCTASGGTNSWSGNRNLSGTFSTGALYNTTTYNITCINGSGQSASDSVTITVGGQQQSPTVTIYANPYSINSGDNSMITWSSNNATSCTASGGTNSWSGSRSLSGSFYTGALYTNRTYSITCTNNNGNSAYDSVTVYVDDNNNNSPATVSISADRTNISYNESTTIRWYPYNADYCYGSGGSNGWSGTRNAFSGTFYTGPLAYTTTYTISCSNNSGSSGSRSVTVYVGNQSPIVNPAYSTLTAITNPATSITSNSAQLNGLILNSSNSYFNDSANAWFEWGTTYGLGNKTPVTSVGSLASVRHASFLTGLSGGTTYYFRVVAENSSWRNIGSILNFTTTGTQNTAIIQPAKTPGTALVLISSSVDRNQPIVPTIDNSRPHPGDEINYTVNYQNVGTASVTGLTLQLNLPAEVDYLSSNPSNPTISGNTLIFKLGTLRAGGQGIATARVRVRDNIPAGTNLNFPATLSYVDPSGVSQSVSANVTAEVWDESSNSFLNLGANVFGSGFFPRNIFGWLLLILIILALILLARYLFSQPFSKKTTTTIDQPLGKKTTTTTIQ